MNNIPPIVSFENDELILVDKNDLIVGHASKLKCHEANGILHRAFSTFIFNDSKELLLQRRSKIKKLWPLYWSNSCCSHPRKNENMETATHRRVKEELGLDVPTLKYLFKFEYHAVYNEHGSEHENCSVYIGKSNDPVKINTNEIAEYDFISMHELESRMNKNPDSFTPWFLLEWKRILENHMEDIEALF